jgi:peptide chain release factor 2
MPPSVWTCSGGSFDVAHRREERTALEQRMAAPDFWNKREEAQQTVARLSSCKNLLEPFDAVARQLDELATLAEFAAEDESMLGEADTLWPKLQKSLERLELVSFLGGRFDRSNAIMTIHAGQGGTESQDWANMLLRMYLRWMEDKGFEATVLGVQPGEVAGIKSAAVMVKGEYAYGYLQAENGVHRLVRISPYDANKRRHTSFAAVEVSPEISDDIEIEVQEKDLKFDTYRSSGAGGQHVNTTDSAVRITHLPTGIVVYCQSERSQHQNRETCMNILRSKLYEREQAMISQTIEKQVGPREENTWGSQIRSYVLQPYQMVKDLRTEVETSNTGAVLDGDLDMFIEAYLKTVKKHAAK